MPHSERRYNGETSKIYRDLTLRYMKTHGRLNEISSSVLFKTNSNKKWKPNIFLHKMTFLNFESLKDYYFIT